MYNDEVMALYLLIAIYYAISQCPKKASVLLAIAMSIKLTAIFIIPAFLGVVVTSHGIPALLKSLAIIIGL